MLFSKKLAKMGGRFVKPIKQAKQTLLAKFGKVPLGNDRNWTPLTWTKSSSEPKPTFAARISKSNLCQKSTLWSFTRTPWSWTFTTSTTTRHSSPEYPNHSANRQSEAKRSAIFSNPNLVIQNKSSCLPVYLLYNHIRNHCPELLSKLDINPSRECDTS